jgi:hypothetical protein
VSFTLKVGQRRGVRDSAFDALSALRRRCSQRTVGVMVYTSPPSRGHLRHHSTFSPVRSYPIGDKDVIMRSKIPGLKALAIPAVIGLCGLTVAGTAQAEAAAQPAPRVPAHVVPLSTDPDPVTSPNLLSAASFEQSLAGWQRFVPSGGTVNWANYNTAFGAPAPAHDGAGYLAINTDSAGGSVYQDVAPYGVGGTYEASVWLSSQSGSASGTFCVWSLAGANTSVCTPYTVSSATGYQNFALDIAVPQSTSALRFQVYPTPNGGTTDIDTASLARIS